MMAAYSLAPGGTIPVHNKTAGIIPAALSPTSLVHLGDARVELIKGEFIVDSWGEQLINGNVIKAEDTEPKFPLFAKLPTELQDKIRSHCIPLLPRKVDVTDTDGYYPGPGRNKSVVMTRINKRTRTDTTTFYGYVRPQSPKVSNSSFLFNPEVDKLFLSHEDLRATRWTKTDVRKCLEAADVLGRVRSVALDANKGYHTGWMENFKLYTALELVFVIIDHLNIEAGSEVGPSRNRCGAYGMRL
ncbi:hypothetical protein BKA61DRAFT_243670 [Leptodontidium sp. MPI-SDFR-AT-0119]|nr:hypothetical protein BKA61DRAFT_243670 [Leptodontidium sp. MPI-SDFR-AT-0119]